jgi:hypothetical protein
VLVACAPGFSGSAGQAQAAAGDAYDAAVLTDTPWTYFKLEDSSGATGSAAADSSGGGHNGKYIPGFGQASFGLLPGKYGKAVHIDYLGYVGFDGFGISGPQVADFAAEFWFRSGPGQTAASHTGLFTIGTIAGPFGPFVTAWLSAGSDPGRLQLSSASDFTGTLTFGGRIDDGVWHHIAIVRQAGVAVTAYVDGAAVGSNPAASAPYGPGMLAFGNSFGQGTGIDFYEDSGALYTHTLSPGRVAAHAGAIDDGTPPDVNLSGTLWDSDGADVAQASYDLVVRASDGSAELPDSGVASIEVLVDSVRRFFDSQACPAGSCALTDSWQFQPALYAVGTHNIDIVVTDQAGRTTTESEDVNVVRAQSQPSQRAAVSTFGPRRIDGGKAGDRSGAGVADVGDLNGDGLDDYAIGAPAATNVTLRTGSGSVYIVYGTASTAVLNLATLGTNGFRIDGATLGEAAGSALAVADVDDDSAPDLLIGAPGGLIGKVYVVFGSALKLRQGIDLASLGTRGFVITGPAVPGVACPNNPKKFGAVLASPGAGSAAPHADVNGDGRDDIAIGSPTDGNNLRLCSGSTYVVFGKATTTAVNATALGTLGFRIDGAAPNDELGSAAAVVGDVSGSGLAAVAAVAPGRNLSGRTSAGTGYVVYGKATSTAVDVGSLGTQGFPVYGATGDKLGSSVAPGGDMAGDGEVATLFGGHGVGVALGHETTDPVDLAAPDPSLGYRITPLTGIAYDAAAVASAGDLNGDFTPDVLVGFPSANSSGGEADPILSQDGLDILAAAANLLNLPGQLGSQILGDASGNQAGAAVSGVEVGGDGQPAMLVGAPAARSAGGSTYVVPSGSLTANSSRSSGGSALDSHHCYPKAIPAYPYNDPEKDFPLCRKTLRGNTERTRTAPKKGYRGHATHTHTPPVGGNIRKKIPTDKPLNAYAPVALRDSRGTHLGYLQQVKDASARGRFRLLDTAQALITEGTSQSVQVEGTPCVMSGATNVASDTHVLISMQGPGSSAITGLRALILRTALPSYPLDSNPGSTNNQVIDAGWSDCNRPSSYKHLTAVAVTYNKPAFTQDFANPASNANELYQGRAAATSSAKCSSALSPTCGTNYTNYVFPRLTLSFPSLATASGSTTAVTKGGVTRAVVKDASPGVTATRRDQIGYVDHNLPCSHVAVAQWQFLSVDGLYAWYPVRTLDGFTRTCST